MLAEAGWAAAALQTLNKGSLVIKIPVYAEKFLFLILPAAIDGCGSITVSRKCLFPVKKRCEIRTDAHARVRKDP